MGSHSLGCMKGCQSQKVYSASERRRRSNQNHNERRGAPQAFSRPKIALLRRHPGAVSVEALAWIKLGDRLQTQGRHRIQLPRLEKGRPVVLADSFFAGVNASRELIASPQLALQSRSPHMAT